MDHNLYHAILHRAHRAHYVAQYACDVRLLLPLDVDEVSVLFRTEADLEEFMHCVVMDDAVHHFNSIDLDIMQRQGLCEPEEFSVRFEFLRIHNADWRIEAMCVLDGNAPLHEKELLDRGNGSIMHASYKLPTFADYQHDVEDGGRLGGYGGTRVAEYINSYGAFSYWNFDDLGYLYLKPRVNLRDTQPSVSGATT